LIVTRKSLWLFIGTKYCDVNVRYWCTAQWNVSNLITFCQLTSKASLMFLIESVNGLYWDWSALLRNFSIISCIWSFLDLSSDMPLCNRTVADMNTKWWMLFNISTHFPTYVIVDWSLDHLGGRKKILARNLEYELTCWLCGGVHDRWN